MPSSSNFLTKLASVKRDGGLLYRWVATMRSEGVDSPWRNKGKRPEEALFSSLRSVSSSSLPSI